MSSEPPDHKDIPRRFEPGPEPYFRETGLTPAGNFGCASVTAFLVTAVFALIAAGK